MSRFLWSLAACMLVSISVAADPAPAPAPAAPAPAPAATPAPAPAAAPMVVPVPDPAAATGSLWGPRALSLYGDTTAHAVGDLLTVIVLLDATSSTEAKHETSKGVAASGGPGTGILRSFPALGVKADRSTAGSGASQASTSLTDHITVTVSEVLPNGNLRVVGTRAITLEKDAMTLTFTGTVRPKDIAPDNTISSIQVADLCVVSIGNGPIAEKQRPGILARLLGFLW